MWMQENRGRYDRSKLRYPSDLTDDEWALISAHEAGRQLAHGVRARYRQRRDVYPEHWLPVGDAAEGTATT